MTISGREDAYIGFRNYPDEKVTIVNTDSLTITNDEFGPIWFDHVNYNMVDGINVKNSIGFVYALDSHHNIVKNCDFDTSRLYPRGSKRGGVLFYWSNHNKILDNFIIKGTDSLSLVRSDYNLVSGNTLRYAGHDIWNIKCGSYNIIRNNYFENRKPQKLGSIFDCETATLSHYSNGDLAQQEPIVDSTKHNLVESNIFADADQTYYSTSNGNGIQFSAQNSVIRRNVFYNNGVGIGFSHYGDEAYAVRDTRVYHNVFHNNKCGAVRVTPPKSGEVIFKNNILHDNKGHSKASCQGTSAAQVLFRKGIKKNLFIHNNIYSPLGNKLVGREFGEDATMDWYGRSFRDNLSVDPDFVDEKNHNYKLKAASPMIDAGAFLGKIKSSSGKGSIIKVDDAAFFFDGFGITGVMGDLVQLEGSTETARIINVDYKKNMLTLDREISWQKGQGISLIYSGSSPDMGVFEYGG